MELGELEVTRDDLGPADIVVNGVGYWSAASVGRAMFPNWDKMTFCKQFTITLALPHADLMVATNIDDPIGAGRYYQFESIAGP